MKSIICTTVLLVTGAAAGFCQGPPRPLVSVFGPKIAANLTFNDSTPVSTQILNATGEDTTISQNTWVEIKGSNLAQNTRIWGGGDFVNNQLPTSLDGVSATVNGKSAFVYYISPTQVNILTPIDPGNPTGAGIPVQVKTQFGTSAVVNTTMQQYSLGFFAFNSDRYAAAVHSAGDCSNYASGTCLLGPPGLFPTAPTWTTPAKPGEVILLYGNGFGPVNPPLVNGAAFPPATQLPTPWPVITIGGIPAQVQFAGIVSAGQYQFNVVVPASVPDGDNILSATYNGFTTHPGVFIPVQR